MAKMSCSSLSPKIYEQIQTTYFTFLKKLKCIFCPNIDNRRHNSIHAKCHSENLENNKASPTRKAILTLRNQNTTNLLFSFQLNRLSLQLQLTGAR